MLDMFRRITLSLISYLLFITVVLYEVWARKDPYEGEDASLVLKAVADPIVRKRVPIPPHMPDQIKALMLDCTDEDPLRRPSFEEIWNRLNRFDNHSFDVFPSFEKPGRNKYEGIPPALATALREGRSAEGFKRAYVSLVACEMEGFNTIVNSMEKSKVRDESTGRSGLLFCARSQSLVETGGRFAGTYECSLV